MTNNAAYRAAAGVALAAAFLLMFFNVAVGVIGPEDDDVNVLGFVVLAVGVIGVMAARFQPAGMARALLVTAFAHGLVAAIALSAGFGSTMPDWQRKIVVLSGFFVALWLLSAWLFRKAARDSVTGAKAGSPSR